MPSTFQIAGGEVHAVLNAVMKAHHPQLLDAGVKIGVLLVDGGDGPAIKHAGYPAAATVKVVPLADRLTKNYDAEIRLDVNEWDNIREPRRKALLDHELSHLALVRDEYGRVKTDDNNRPKLRLAKGDWNGGDGFLEVVARHGKYAYEYTNALHVQSVIAPVKKATPSLFDGVGE